MHVCEIYRNSIVATKTTPFTLSLAQAYRLRSLTNNLAKLWIIEPLFKVANPCVAVFSTLVSACCATWAPHIQGILDRAIFCINVHITGTTIGHPSYARLESVQGILAATCIDVKLWSIEIHLVWVPTLV
jgi:hypothetical protein